jgi:hypothetical protein
MTTKNPEKQRSPSWESKSHKSYGFFEVGDKCTEVGERWRFEWYLGKARSWGAIGSVFAVSRTLPRAVGEVYCGGLRGGAGVLAR